MRDKTIHKMFWIILILTILISSSLMFIKLLDPAGQKSSIKIQDNGQSYVHPIKLAYPIYEKPYSLEEYHWLAKHSGLLIAAESHGPYLQYLRENNPDIILLDYKFAGITNESKMGHSASGFSKIYDLHKDWFIKTVEGNIVYDDYSSFSRNHSFFLDFANPGWTSYASRDYIYSIEKYGFDGIFLDVIYLDKAQYMPQVLDYGSIEYENAVYGHLSSINKDFGERLFIINGASLINHEPLYEWRGKAIESIWEEAYGITDGIVEEGFANIYTWYPKKPWRDQDKWEQQINALEDSGKAGKYYIAVAHNSGLDREETMFNVVSYLLGMHERSFYMNLNPGGYKLGNYRSDYDAFKDIYDMPLGRPVQERRYENGVWSRRFENGIVTLDFKKKDAEIKLD
ncbi:MAG: putative glycoside hydrolase family 15 protein [Candidatus Woesearchaeota archaeon]|nr:putative glycoside hydrolase family 15 protein [Candidatus Woesearchaeota archaeon]